MGRLVPLPRRELFVDSRGSAMRASWHRDRGMAVLSLWHDDECVGTVRLRPEEAIRLGEFLLGHLASAADASVTRPADPATSG